MPAPYNICVYCGTPLVIGKKFCSLQCKAESQKKTVSFICAACGKEFKMWPCLKRKTNYCSLACYRNNTRRKEKRLCRVCGKEFLVKSYLIRKGFGFFCSRECQHKTYPEKIHMNCKQCGKEILVCPSKVHLTKFCSKKCTDDFLRDYVSLVCHHCKKTFQLPRWDLNRGRGKFCSYDCFVKYKGESSLEERMRKILIKFKIRFLQEYKIGRFHADFLIPELNLVLECDGEYWHLSKKGAQRDKRKDRLIGKLGYKILRLSGQKILKSSDKEIVKRIVSC